MYIGLYTDVISEHEAMDKVWSDAQHDPLTGLPNRLLLTERIERAIEACSAVALTENCTRLALLFIDLDGFK